MPAGLLQAHGSVGVREEEATDRVKEEEGLEGGETGVAADCGEGGILMEHLLNGGAGSARMKTMKVVASSPASARATRSVESSTKSWMGFENTEKGTSVSSVTRSSTAAKI